MESQLLLLRQIQQMDSKIREIQLRAESDQDELDDLQANHENLKDALNRAHNELDAARATLRAKVTELEENQERFNQSKGKLTDVGNTRQYNALERELENLKMTRALLEEERDALQENVATYESQLKDRKAKLDDLEGAIKSKGSEMQGESASAASEATKFEKERDVLKADLPAPLRRRYEFILARRDGVAVAAAVDGACTGCNMAVPPQVFNELRAENRILECANCQRILFYQAAGQEEVDD